VALDVGVDCGGDDGSGVDDGSTRHVVGLPELAVEPHHAFERPRAGAIGEGWRAIAARTELGYRSAEIAR